MKSYNLCSLVVRIGKCNLNIKTPGTFAVSLELADNVSALSPFRQIRNGSLNFNTTLKLSVERHLLQEAKCRLILHFVRENRQRKVIGVASFKAIDQHNQGFRYHNFGQCADNEAQIELSVTYSDFEYTVRSQIQAPAARKFNREDQVDGVQELSRSRGQDSVGEDSLFGKEHDLLKQSKAQSNIVYFGSGDRQRASFSRIREQFPQSRQKREQNLSQCAPEEIISHYQNEVEELHNALKEKEEWASGMRSLVKQLEAENQLLKELTLEELAQCQIKNMEDGISAVSKLIHRKLKASKSRQASSRIVTVGQDGQMQGQSIVAQQRQKELSQKDQKVLTLTATRSLSNLPKLQQNQEFQSQYIKNNQEGKGYSKEELEKAFNLLSNQCKDEVQEGRASNSVSQTFCPQPKDLSSSSQLADLQEELFRTRQQKHELFEISNQIYSQLKYVKEERDSFKFDLVSMEKRHKDLSSYVQSLKEQNRKLKQQINELEKNQDLEVTRHLQEENLELKQQLKQLERQREESIKALKQFTNDVLSARQELILREEEIQNLKTKMKKLQEIYKDNQTVVSLNTHQGISTSTPKIQNHHDVEGVDKDRSYHGHFGQLIQQSIKERRTLQERLFQLKFPLGPDKEQEKAQNRQEKAQQLQVVLDRMFLDILKNKRSLGNMGEIERGKRDVCSILKEVISSY